jgi:hypothetical protein
MALNRNWGAILSLARRLDWLAGEKNVFVQMGSVGHAVLATLPDPALSPPHVLMSHDGWGQFDELTAATFLVAQREITFFVSAVGWINRRAAAPLQCSTSKSELLKRSPNIELLDAAANYVKHADEWPHNWGDASHRGQQKTIRVLENVGVVGVNSWFPMPLLREKLGIDRDLGKVASHLHSWGTDIVEQVADELEARKEIPSGWKSASASASKIQSGIIGHKRYLASGV